MGWTSWRPLIVISSSAAQAGSERVSRRYMTRSPTWPTRNTSPATRSWSSTSDDNSWDPVALMVNDKIAARAREYSKTLSISLGATPLGFGDDGAVWTTSRHTVLKVFERGTNYALELEC